MLCLVFTVLTCVPSPGCTCAHCGTPHPLWEGGQTGEALRCPDETTLASHRGRRFPWKSTSRTPPPTLFPPSSRRSSSSILTQSPSSLMCPRNCSEVLGHMHYRPHCRKTLLTGKKWTSSDSPCCSLFSSVLCLTTLTLVTSMGAKDMPHS